LKAACLTNMLICRDFKLTSWTQDIMHVASLSIWSITQQSQ
jgi:hypothetical protein